MELRCLSMRTPREGALSLAALLPRIGQSSAPTRWTSWEVPDQYSCTIFSLAANNSQSGAVADHSQELKSLRHHKR